MRSKIKYALMDNTGNLVRIKKDKYTSGYSSFDSMAELEKEVKQSYLYKSDIKTFFNKYKPCLIKIAPFEFVTLKESEPVKINPEKKSEKAFMALIDKWMQGDMKEPFNYFNLKVCYIDRELVFYVKSGLYIFSKGCVDVEEVHENKIFFHEYKPWLKKTSLKRIYSKVVKPDVFKSDKDTVYYLDGDDIESCDRSEWY